MIKTSDNTFLKKLAKQCNLWYSNFLSWIYQVSRTWSPQLINFDKPHFGSEQLQSSPFQIESMSMDELKQCVASRLDLMDVNDSNNSDDEDIDDDWDEAEEDSDMVESIPCLFESQSCGDSFGSLEKAILHLKHAHKLDFLELKLVHKMDCYLFIKLINFFRKHNPTPGDILKAVLSSKGDTSKLPWSADEYMKPHLTDDPWLMYDYDDIEESVDDLVPLNGVHHVNVEHGRITMTQEHYASLQDQIKLLSQQLQEKTIELEMKREDMDQMRDLMQELLSKQDEGGDSKTRRHDKFYFNSYEDAHIHAEMIKDTVRTESYKAAILNNPSLFHQKHVLDVGAGTGILSIFAAQAGAAKVYAVEKSDIAYETMDIVRKNGFSSRIEVYHKLVEELELPVERVDVILSEWMGYFLLFETMVDSVIEARDRFLAPGGVVMPNQFTLYLAGAYDEEVQRSLVDFWSDVHGQDMSAMTRLVYPDVQVLTLPASSLRTRPVLLTSMDLNNPATGRDCVNFSTAFSLETSPSQKESTRSDNVGSSSNTDRDSRPSSDNLATQASSGENSQARPASDSEMSLSSNKEASSTLNSNIEATQASSGEDSQARPATDSEMRLSSNKEASSNSNVDPSSLNSNVDSSSLNSNVDPSSQQDPDKTTLNCLVAWFDTSFACTSPVVQFSTSPASAPTHWKQSVFLLREPVTLNKGENLAGSLTCERMENDSRSLNITLTLGGTTQVYQLQ